MTYVSPFEPELMGGHPHSLGNTEAVVETVLAEPDRFEELLHCYQSHDEVVRLRTSNAMKRICKVRLDMFIPHIDHFLTDIATIDQASTQWTLVQLFDMLEKHLSPEQRTQAQSIMQHNLATHQDWIVLIQSMTTLDIWAQEDPLLRAGLIPHLDRLALDPCKSVAKRAQKLRASYFSKL